MASYLLLRDNKESGPFTLNELQHFGLKPYDLIWVQGKSAAWRYPSEIAELKPFAPVVEEQPYDRFFKKSSEEVKKDESPVIEKSPEIEEQYSKYIPPPQPLETNYTPKRSVFVTLPGNKQVTLKNDPPPVMEKPVVEPTPTISISENPAAAEIKYSQPLDEIKEMYVKTLLERKEKKGKKGMLLAGFKKAAVFGGLIILGVLAGFIFRSKSSGKTNDQAVPELLQVSTSIANEPSAKTMPDEITPSEPAPEEYVVKTVQPKQDENPSESYRINDESIQKIEEPAPTVKIRKETMMIVPKRKENYNHINPGVQVNAITGERERTLRNSSEGSFVPEKAGNSLKDLVSVASNDYKRVAFGGIRDLYLTVTNRSAYELDQVIVELQYLKPSEEPLRTENINFKSIAPNGSSTIRIPDTNRGIKVNYRIIHID